MTPSQRNTLNEASSEAIELRDLLLLCAMGITHAGGDEPRAASNANALFATAKLTGSIHEAIESVLNG